MSDQWPKPNFNTDLIPTGTTMDRLKQAIVNALPDIDDTKDIQELVNFLVTQQAHAGDTEENPILIDESHPLTDNVRSLLSKLLSVGALGAVGGSFLKIGEEPVIEHTAQDLGSAY